jgi:hypothetical protein
VRSTFIALDCASILECIGRKESLENLQLFCGKLQIS